MHSPETYQVIFRTFIAWTVLSIALGSIIGTIMYRFDKRMAKVPKTPPFPWERR